MRTNKKLSIESLERREVFSVTPGLEGLTPQATATQITTEEIVYELNQGRQLTSASVTRPDARSVDAVFDSGIPHRYGGGLLSQYDGAGAYYDGAIHCYAG